ncbi:MAG: gamma-glutamyltransferase family protein [Alkalispirochaetaceae bacterium]
MVRRIALAAAVFLLVTPGIFAQTGDRMAITTAHHLATEAGMEVLREGGNAADAAFTVAAVLTIVEPWFSSVMGGGTWALYYDRDTGSVRSLDGVGPAAAGATPEYFQRNAARTGMHQAVVPGAWGGWMEWLKEFGSMPLDELLEPAIEMAEEGYEVYGEMYSWLERGENSIRNWPYSRELYMPDGELLEVGDIVRQPGMAETFRDVQGVWRSNLSRGRSRAFDAANDHFYRGPIAESIVEYSDDHGGLFELSDFTNFRTGLVNPISIDYRDMEVYQNPPNSQGISMLIALNILEGYDFSRYSVDDPEAVHLQVEAMKIGHGAKHRHVGDPEWNEIPMNLLLSDEYAREAREAIEMDSALTWPLPATITEVERSNTTTYSIVDSDGNGAAVTTSLGAQFLVAGPSGVHINNRMRMFYYREGLPNTVQPGKKVRHTSNPYLVLRDGELYILGGNTGVDTQPQGQMQQFISVVEFGLSAQEAVARPRYLTRAFPAGQWPFEAHNDLAVEPGTPEALREGLEEIGHVTISGGIWGNAQMIVIDPQTGAIEVGTDPRGGVGRGIVE